MNVDNIQEHRYFVVKCEMFDEVEIKASAKAIRLTSFAVSSTSSIKVGLKKVKASPFKTVFVVDEARNKAIFALTQNPAFEAEAKKKGGGDPPPPPPPPLECAKICDECERAGSVCLVDATSCWCIAISDDPSGVPQQTPFTADDNLESILKILS